jgi:hypothetical protein
MKTGSSPVLALIALLLCGYYFLMRPLPKQTPAVRPIQTQKYDAYVSRLTGLTNELHQQVLATSEGYVIQNTFLELRQEWLLTDVIARTTNDPLILKSHLPSDSLQNLNDLCFPEYDDSKRQAMLLELKKLKKRLQR